jgi:hypothetical protein
LKNGFWIVLLRTTIENIKSCIKCSTTKEKKKKEKKKDLALKVAQLVGEPNGSTIDWDHTYPSADWYEVCDEL